MAAWHAKSLGWLVRSRCRTRAVAHVVYPLDVALPSCHHYCASNRVEVSYNWSQAESSSENAATLPVVGPMFTSEGYGK